MKSSRVLRALVIAGLLGAYAIVKLLERILGRRSWCALFLLLAVVAIAIRCGACDAHVRVGTYNIRRFGVEKTDLERLTAIVMRSRADVLAVQEIQSEPMALDLARRLSRHGRRMEVALSRCGGRSAMRVGFLYDATRLTLLGTKEYPELDPTGEGSCAGDRPGLVGTFEPAGGGGRRFQLLVLHLVAGGDADKVARRKEQWRRAYRIAAQSSYPIAILGDANSTGYLDDRDGERTFIDDEAKRAGMEVATRSLACSEYFQPEPPAIRPSLLDHVVVTPGLARAGSIELHGYCAELACRPSSTPHREYETVSDHCPVTLDIL
jgi:endonuclease/exonuclease/phosphatase family metal-dependent hydrolase